MNFRSPDFAAAVICVLALLADGVIKMAENAEVLGMIPPQLGVAFLALVAAARWYVVHKASIAKLVPGAPTEQPDHSNDPTPVTGTSDVWPDPGSHPIATRSPTPPPPPTRPKDSTP